MNTILLKGASFYEYEGNFNANNEGIDENDILGFLSNVNRYGIDEVIPSENYLITYIKYDNGEHVAKYVNGLELKLNYRNYDNESHGGLNIWNVNDLIEYN